MSGPTPPASYTGVSLQFIPLWLSYCGILEEGKKLPKAQDCWVHQKFGVVLFFEVPAAPSWRDLGFHL